MAESNPEKKPTRRRGLTPNTIRAVDRDLLWAADAAGILGAIGSEGVERDELFKAEDPEILNHAKRALVDHLRARRFVIQKEGRVQINPRYSELMPGTNFLHYILDLRDWYEKVYNAIPQLQQGQIPTLEQRAYDGIVEISEGLATALPAPISEDYPRITTQSMKALDLACGKLHVLRTLAKENPGLAVTGIERNPKYLQFLQKTLPEEGLTDRVNIIEGDVQTATQELADHQYGFVFASHIIHWLTPQETQRLFREAKRLLSPNGAFFINEDYLADSGLVPRDSARKNDSMAALGYQIFTRAQTIEMLKEAGFSDPQTRAIDSRRILFECFE